MKIQNSDFVHWHCHTCFSTFDGLAKVNDLVMQARKMGFPALAMTDHGNIGGWIKFIKYCSATKDKNGEAIDASPISPILGMEAYLSSNHENRTTAEQTDGRRGNRHLNLFAKNFKGYQNLCELSQLAFIDGFFHNPRIDIKQLAEHSEGIMVGTACLSSVVNANLLYDRYGHAKKTCAVFKDIFGEDFFLEVMYHGIPEEAAIIPGINKLSRDMDVPIIASNDCHYIKKEHAKSQEVLMCMSTSRCLHDPKRLRFPYGEFYLKSAEEMNSVWGETPEVMSNSIAMLERIDHEDISSNLFGGMRLPPYKVPDEYSGPLDYLTHLAHKGMRRLGWDKSRKHVAQLELELGDVKVALENNGYDFATYFLIVWDYVNFARKENIFVGYGRGSGYASVLLHCLGICSGVDPIETGLVWERFLGFGDFRFILDNDFGFEDSQKLLKIAGNYTKSEKAADGSGISRY